MKDRILLIGPQGSGKSTQAVFLSQHFGVPNISTGDIFRKLSSEDSEPARKVKEILASGRLVDDETTAQIVKERLAEEDCQNGFVIDGYPRSIRQIEIFDPGFNKVFYLAVPNEEVIRRLTKRGREDDTPELIQTRLDLYNQQTQPLLDYYRKKQILVEIDGTGDIQKVQDEIKKFI